MNPIPAGEHNLPTHRDETATVPWWRVGVMWVFFVGGLGGVVVASFALLLTAVNHRDIVLPHDAPPSQATQAAPVSKVPNQPNSPAMQARNHAATPAR